MGQILNTNFLCIEDINICNLILHAQLSCFVHFRSYAKALASPEADFPTSTRSTESNLPQKVLESLFNISKSPEYEPKTMNWKNVVKKLQLLGPGFDVCPSSVTEPQQDTYGIHH